MGPGSPVEHGMVKSTLPARHRLLGQRSNDPQIPIGSYGNRRYSPEFM